MFMKILNSAPNKYATDRLEFPVKNAGNLHKLHTNMKTSREHIEYI